VKQCESCRRLVSDRAAACSYCGHEVLTPVVVEREGAVSRNYRINTHELMVDGVGYEIVRPLGKGGFGTVVEARSLADGKSFAMKVPLMFDMACTNNNAHDDEIIRRSAEYIENEIKTVADFQSDSFLFLYGEGHASVFYRGEDIRFPVFRMELAEATLDDLIRLASKGRLVLCEDEKKKIVREVVNAMTSLHDLNIVHRDLSPDNIFIVDRAGKLSYVLGDFGASKRLYDTANLGKSTRVVGHTAYLDPERFANKDYRYDFRIDIYSLGIILTEVMIGRYWRDLFEGEDVSLASIDFESDVVHKMVRPLVDATPVTDVLAKAVRNDPEDRYRTIHEFGEALFQALGITGEEKSVPPTMVEAEVTPGRITIPIRFTLPLPFEEDDATLLHESTVFSGDPVTLRDFRGVRIELPDRNPVEVTVKGTGLYDAAVSGNGVLLSFKSSYFRSILNDHADDVAGATGRLSFQAIVDVKEGDA